METRSARRLPATEVKTHLGRIVQEVVATGTPVIVQTRGDDQVAIISLRDFESLQPGEEEQEVSLRERVRGALRRAGLLSEPTAEELAEIREYEARTTEEERERMLAWWRGLRLTPSLSEILLRNRERESG